MKQELSHAKKIRFDECETCAVRSRLLVLLVCLLVVCLLACSLAFFVSLCFVCLMGFALSLHVLMSAPVCFLTVARPDPLDPREGASG